MKTKKLLEKVRDLLDGETAKKKKELLALGKLMRKLKEKRKELERKIDETSDADKLKKLGNRMALIKLQLDKGKATIEEGRVKRAAKKAGKTEPKPVSEEAPAPGKAQTKPAPKES